MKSLGTIVAITALVCSACAWAATAPPRGIVQSNNINDPVNHPYSQSQYNTVNCSAGSCYLLFSVTANETLIQHVSCTYYLPTSIPTTQVLLYNGTSGDVNYLPVVSYGTSGGYAYQVINESTYLFAQNGNQVVLEVNTASSSTAILDFYCTISGYHN